jgi:arginyl-tRNA synthetase
MFRSWLHETLSKKYPGHLFDVLVPPDPGMGDYSVNLAFILAKHEKKSPREVAEDICTTLMVAGSDRIARCAVAGPGFVNIFLHDTWLHAQLGKIQIPQEGLGRKIIIEYPSTNIAKPMHVGHSRPAFIGDALARVHEALGYDVVRWDHLGDWGTQFGMILAAYKEWGDEAQVRERPLEALNDLYVKWQAKIKEDATYADRSREEFAKLEQGDLENTKLWRWFTEESLKESQRMYSRLGLLESQKSIGESAYLPQLEELIEDLTHKDIAKESEGALIVDLESFGLPVAMIRKSDGASVYLTRDIASLKHRISEESPEKILYVVANQQALHLEQLFAISQLLKLGPTQLVHVKFGLVLGEAGKKLSTREGTAVLLQEVIDEVITKAQGIISSKNSLESPADIKEAGEVIGIGALKYNDLKQHPHTDVTFDWEAMLDLRGNSGPYLQYTYARLASILRKLEGAQVKGHDLEKLTHPAERALLRHMLDYGYAIAQCAKMYALNGLALHLYELAEKANAFYEQVHIADDTDDSRKSARIELVRQVMHQLKGGLELLGIQVLERI